MAKPVNGEPIRIYGWREDVTIKGAPKPVLAKLDTGAKTSSIHAEKKEMFERDGEKWMRFVFTDPTAKDEGFKVRIEAPLVRVARIKDPGGESEAREVVMLDMKIGERSMRAEFTLKNRKNMLAPILIGRTLLKELGAVDPGRTHLADQKIIR
ncbi:MAG: ATP-dependent zinc protease [Akkermansiaceae bacterium]|nr:ATP-dependent zinc protease [Akkermansiaceae bacterium]